MRNFTRVLILMAAPAVALVAQSDPPSRVGRLNYISGPVSLQPAGVDDWVGAELNRPLTTGDRVWVDQDGRAELHLGAAALRLNSRTAFEFLNLDDNNVQIRLTEGTLSITLRRLDPNETFEVDTPNLAFSLLRPGEYRIDANPDSATTVITVREGQGEVTGGNQAFAVNPRQQARVNGVDTVTYDLLDAPGVDGWDQWCRGRERREERSQSARYVSRDMVGYQDLDDYGDWRPVADYGTVWVPRGVAAGWSPYHNGHWAWIEPWGWTWVDDAPWGFAPFHYGRWIYAGYWAWVPGPVAVRPVYAPALVAWVGGPRFSLSFRVGAAEGVAWFPLGPREAYVPAYRASPRYVTRINNSTTVINNINVTNIRYVNQSAPGAITAVPRSAFAGARPVQQVSVNVNVRQVQQGQVMNTAPVAPQRESVLGRAGGALGGVARPPAAVVNRQVVAKTTPPPPPIPFERRQAALAGNPGHPLEPAAVQSIRASQPAGQRNWVRPAEAVHTQSPAPERARPGYVDQPQRGQPGNGAQQQEQQRIREQQQQRDAEQRRLQQQQQQPQRDAEQQRLQREQQLREAEQRRQQQQQQQQQQRDAEQQRLQREQQQREAEQRRQQQQQPRPDPDKKAEKDKAEKDKAEKDKKPPQ